MNAINLRIIVVTFCAAAACLTAGEPARAVTAPFERLTARAPFDGDSGAARIDILIERWSTDHDFEVLRAGWQRSRPADLFAALQGLRRRAGVLLIPGVQASGARARVRHPVYFHFARQVESPSGRQIVIAADRELAFGRPTEQWPATFEFSLLDIRFGADGAGIGKVGEGAELAFNQRTRTIELAGYADRPARLIDVRVASGKR